MATEEKVPEALDQVIEDFSNKMELPATYEPPSPLTGSYLLIILGEPHSQEHKDIILQRLLKGNHFSFILNDIIILFGEKKTLKALTIKKTRQSYYGHDHKLFQAL